MALLTVIIAISFWFRQITINDVFIVIIILGFFITVFMMITFFFQSYTITVITLETSSSFSGQVILTVFGDISSFEPLDFERAIFEEEAAVFRLTIWVGAGGGVLLEHCSTYCRSNLLFSFFLWWHWRTVVMSLLPIFFTKEITAPLVFGFYFFKNISKMHYLPNPVVSSHTHHLHKFFNVSYCWLFPSLRVY